MALHTVLIAVTVDDSHSTYAVASEFKYFLPFITSECLDTVTSVIPARIKQPKKYTVWSSSKAGGALTYHELLAHESLAHGSVSSVVITNDIGHIIEAVYNETDIELEYHLMEADHE